MNAIRSCLSGFQNRITHVKREVRNAVGHLRAYHNSSQAGPRGLIREALGFEDMNMEQGKIDVAAAYIKKRIGDRQPEVILTLGSGLGALAGKIEDAVVIPYEDIPCFPRVTEHVAGHAGELIVGKLGGKMVAAMSGRFHLYQGVTAREAVRPLRTLVSLGAKTFIVTNAAGGIKKGFKVGDLMLITDDHNLQFANPLVGPNLNGFGTRFPDMSSPYSVRLADLAKKVAAGQSLSLQEGSYVANLGPNYERPSEIADLQARGFHAVGMSTVLEVLAAVHAKVEVLGITLITNLAAGISEKPLSHEEVKEAGDQAGPKFQALIVGILRELQL